MSPNPRSIAAPTAGPALVLAAAAALALVPGARGDHPSWPLMGYEDLLARLADPPTGAGVRVATVEAPLDGGYRPNPNDAQFDGVTISTLSGATGNSSHATNVGRYLYGADWGMAAGVSEAWVWEAANFVLSGYLRTGAGAQGPTAPPFGIRVINHSWVGALGGANDVDALRRADFAIDVHRVHMVMGLPNAGDGSFPLLGSAYHGITVGRRDGQHETGTTTVDGAGRQKPDLVAPGSATSWAAPMTSAAIALLLETIADDPDLATDLRADDPDVLKAILMASAAHEDDADGVWSNGPATSGPDRGRTTTPLDPVMGAGTLQVDRAHRTLVAGRVDAASDPAAAGPACGPGWTTGSVAAGASAWVVLTLPQAAAELTVALAWERFVRLSPPSASLADLELELFRLDAAGGPVPLVGDPGRFAGGNVLSASAVDNVEHLHVLGLDAGTYAVRVRRVGGPADAPGAFALAWWLPAAGPAIAGDANGDGTIGFPDLVEILSAWGTDGDCFTDPSGDGTVGFDDLLVVLDGWQ